MERTGSDMIYDYKVKSSKGELIDLKDYKGKVLLLVNTATGCRFTPQYEGLQNMLQPFKHLVRLK